MLTTVRRLVDVQFPQWAGLALTPLNTPGTVNAIVRLGPELVVRLPFAATDPAALRATLAAEGEAAAECGAGASVPVSQLVALGEPDAAYPQPWSVHTWVPGEAATPTSGRATLADELAAQIAAWRRLDTRGRTFTGTGRGGDLTDHDDWVQTCLQRSVGLIDVEGAARLWSRWRSLPKPAARAMTHGDLIPFNLVLRQGRLAGILDAGGFGPADPALDLVCAWHLFERADRMRLRAHLNCGDIEWQRGAAWALQQALGLVWFYESSNPPMAALGRSTITRLLADGAGTS